MNENIDLTKILKNCPKGWEFWSPIFGQVGFEYISRGKSSVNVSVDEHGTTWAFNTDATTSIGDIKSPEIMLYPSKYQRDWSKFTAPWYKKEKFDPKTLQPFDKILVKGNKMDCVWKCSLHSHFDANYRHSFCANTGIYRMCIPYNDDTKHLVGTRDEAPEFYRYWEDKL